MTSRAPTLRPSISRRSFVASAGALSVAVTFGGAVAESEATATSAAFNPNAWVTIDRYGIVTIMSAPAEMGQGTMTGLPICLAEDLDADWSKVRVLQSPAQPKTFGNPLLRMEMSTHGDYSTKGYYEQVRLIGAQTRKVLLLNAARMLNVPVAELSTRPGMVVHESSGRHLNYGSIARRAQVPDPLPAVTVADLKPASGWRLIGKSVPRVDIPGKVNGSAVFGIDVQRPNMLYGGILRPPVRHAAPVTIDDTAARAIPGVVKIIAFDEFIGVIGESLDATRRAKAALRVVWSETAPGHGYDTVAVAAEYAKIAADLRQSGVAMTNRGDVGAAIADAQRVVSGEFSCDHVAHAAMEPTNATALVDGDRVEIWLPTQSPSAVLACCARTAGTTEDKVTLHSMFVGGGFGRLSEEPDTAYETVLLAKAMPGRPVKMTRSREDDFFCDKFRPLAAQRIDVGLDAAGNILGWRHRIVSASAWARYKPALLEYMQGRDIVAGMAEVVYDWPNHAVHYVRTDRGWDVGPWRGIAVGYTAFAIESTIDELAMLQGVDPLALRLTLLQTQPRAREVVRSVAALSEWGRQRPAGRALGLAFASMSGSFAAGVAEVSLDRAAGEIRVHRVWTTIDAGVAVHPHAIIAQVEGGTVMGLGAALYEQINVSNGALQETNFGAYRPPRMSQMPKDIQVRVIASDHPPGGVGEIGVTLIAPAIANAVARLTGKRLRSLPMLPERVKQALNA